MYEYTIPTKAIVAYTTTDWRYQDVLVREPGPHEVLIKLVATSICHTDVANAGNIAPRILGHEGAGKILKCGSDVDPSLRIGEPVLLSFAHCGQCQMCRGGHPAHCRDQQSLNIRGQQLNFALVGGQDERLEDDGTGLKRVIKAGYFGQSSFSGIALVRESSVVSVKDLIKDEELKIFAPLGCGIQTGACAVVNVIKPDPEVDSIAVIGLGGVGLSAVMAAKALGVPTIVAIDILPNRLSLALELGSTHLVNSRGLSESQLCKAIRDLPPFADSNGSLGPTGIVDTTGIPSVLRAALAAVNRMGRVVQLANQGVGSNVAVDLLGHMANGTHLTGTIQGDANPKKSIPMLINWYREGKLPLERLLASFSIEEFERAREVMHTGEIIKPVLIWPE